MSNRRIPPLSTDGEISIMNKYLVEIKKKEHSVERDGRTI
jgi:hypothetical protein